MNERQSLLWELCQTLAYGSIVRVKEPIKVKRLQLVEQGKKVGEYEEICDAQREVFVPPVKEAFEVLCRLAWENDEESGEITHSVPRPN